MCFCDRQGEEAAAAWKDLGAINKAAAHLKADIPSPEADQLHVPFHEPGHCSKHKVRAFLVVQAADETDQWHLYATSSIGRFPVNMVVQRAICLSRA